MGRKPAAVYLSDISAGSTKGFPPPKVCQCSQWLFVSDTDTDTVGHYIFANHWSFNSDRGFLYQIQIQIVYQLEIQDKIAAEVSPHHAAWQGWPRLSRPTLAASRPAGRLANWPTGFPPFHLVVSGPSQTGFLDILMEICYH